MSVCRIETEMRREAFLWIGLLTRGVALALFYGKHPVDFGRHALW